MEDFDVIGQLKKVVAELPDGVHLVQDLSEEIQKQAKECKLGDTFQYERPAEFTPGISLSTFYNITKISDDEVSITGYSTL